MKINRKYWQGYLLLLLAQLMGGICLVGSKSLLATTPAITILTIRSIISFLFLLFIHLISNKRSLYPLRKLSRFDWAFIIAQALCAGAFFNILLLFGLKYTSASVAGIITSSLPAIIVIFSVVFLKERVTFSTVSCVGFAIAGLIIINAHNLHIEHTKQIYGDIIILISLLPEAAYYVLSKIRQNQLPVFLVSAIMNGINIPIYFFFALLQHDQLTRYIFSEQFLLLFVLGIGSALFYVFWLLGSNDIRGSSAGLTTAFMPIATLIISYVFLNEKISIVQFVGMVLVIFSIFFNATSITKGYKKYNNDTK